MHSLEPFIQYIMELKDEQAAFRFCAAACGDASLDTFSESCCYRTQCSEVTMTGKKTEKYMKTFTGGNNRHCRRGGTTTLSQI